MPFFILLALFLNSADQVASTNKEIYICDSNSKNALIGAYLYSKIQERCYQTNLEGRFAFPLLESDSLQFEYTGYDLLNLAAKDVLLVDTVFMSAGKDVELGSTGIGPFLKADKYIAMCKCCSQNKN